MINHNVVVFIITSDWKAPRFDMRMVITSFVFQYNIGFGIQLRILFLGKEVLEQNYK